MKKWVDSLTKQQKRAILLACLVGGAIAILIWVPTPHVTAPMAVPTGPPATPTEELTELHALLNFVDTHAIAIFWWGAFAAWCALQGFIQFVNALANGIGGTCKYLYRKYLGSSTPGVTA
jgi:hypothetical protein